MIKIRRNLKKSESDSINQRTHIKMHQIARFTNLIVSKAHSIFLFEVTSIDNNLSFITECEWE